MKTVAKHQFEAVSLLTTQSGFLDVTIIPVIGQPSWLLPSSLILSVEPFQERIWTYIWRGQDVAVYHLIPKSFRPEKIVVLEGNTSVHRLALQVAGELQTKQLKISEVQDTVLPEGFLSVGALDRQESVDVNVLVDDKETTLVPYMYQAVMVNQEVYVVPDVDMIAHQLVDLDS